MCICGETQTKLSAEHGSSTVPGSARSFLVERMLYKMTRWAMDAALSSPECTLKIKPAFYSIFHVLIIIYKWVKLGHSLHKHHCHSTSALFSSFQVLTPTRPYFVSPDSRQTTGWQRVCFSNCCNLDSWNFLLFLFVNLAFIYLVGLEAGEASLRNILWQNALESF